MKDKSEQQESDDLCARLLNKPTGFNNMGVMVMDVLVGTLGVNAQVGSATLRVVE